ncbi:MAG: PIG-L family deacetylase [Kiritimatiellae bacterium]|nr:PIG-L family deacetylase [Kiritimatiellia bacterium]
MNVLVVGAHPDDEVLGCGGTIAKHAQNGDVVTALILAEGITSRGTDEGLSELKIAGRKANKILGSNATFCNLPDNRMDSVDLLDIVQIVEEYIVGVDVVYTHCAGDLNIDHRLTFEAVKTACRPLPGATIKKILSFEIPSSTEWGGGFIPDYFVDITQTMNIKMEALKAYSSEMRKWPHPRSIEGVLCLNKWRGATVGVGAAEAFQVVRMLK